MRRMLSIMVLSWLAILAGPVGKAYSGSLLNGDFSVAGTPPNPFADWTTSFGDAPTNGGGFAVFAESGTSSLIQLEQAFTLPNGALTLSFEFSLTSVAAGSGGGPPDSFQATLYDASFNPFPTPTDPLLPGFFSMDNTGQAFFNSSFVSVAALSGGWERVTLDLSTLAPQDVDIEFILNENPDGQTSTALLDNVVLTAAGAVPEPRSLLLLATGFCGIFAIKRLRGRSAGG